MKKFLQGISLLVLIATILTQTSCNQNGSIESTKPDSSAKFINFTDLHFNPFYDSLLVPELNKSGIESWDSIFNVSPLKTVSKLYDETNYFLLVSTLQQMKDVEQEPDFIIMAGDFICHDFGEYYTKYTKDNNQDNMHAFMLKTIAYITGHIQSTFPNTIIIPTFGNNDSYCGDYHLQNKGAFLQDFSKLYLPILGNSLSDTEKDNLQQHGYYCLSNPSNPMHKIIALNSIYFSIKYQSDEAEWNCKCNPSLTNQDSIAQQEFMWLEKHLAESKLKNEKVWIITHIPPGVNVFESKKNKEENNPTLFWKEPYNEKFLRLLEKYSSVIYTTMTGHTHMDDFKLHVSDSSKSYIHISPSISPVFGNNPAFQLVEYNKLKAEFTNFTAYYINVGVGLNANWEKEYIFKDVYPVNSLDAIGYDSLLWALNADSTYRLSYGRFYEGSTSNGEKVATTDWHWYRCGISSTRPDVFENCMLNK